MSTATPVVGYENFKTEFGFRTNKETGAKRPSVEVEYPILTKEGIVNALNSEDPNVVKNVMETVNGVIFTSYVRGLVDADSEFDQTKIDALIADGKLSIDFLSNIPRSERNVLSKEDLEKLAVDYVKLMPEITGKSVERVKGAASLFIEKFKKVAGDNAVLTILQDQLMVFVDKAPQEVVETHMKALDFLTKKLEELLEVKITADAL